MPPTPHVVIIGAGFGGLAAAKELAGAPVQVTIVDQRNYHTFQPLLYQVATAGLEGESIAHSVRGIFHGAPNIGFHLGSVVIVDLDRRRLGLADGAVLEWDHLIVSAGAVTATYGVAGVAEHAFGMKSLTDAVRVRSHLLQRFEQADANPALIDEGALTVAVVGGGPTGVELAGALSELFSRVLAKDHPHLDISRARVIVVEATDRLLPALDRRLGEHARRALEAKGIEVRLEHTVESVDGRTVRMTGGEVIPCQTVVWAAGVRAHPLSSWFELHASGRVLVGPDLRVPGHPDVAVIGDLAATIGRRGEVLAQVAPVAIQGGRYVARSILRPATRPFRYRDKGSMATIGRNDAVAQLPGGVRVTGFPGWVMWLGLHLLELIGFRNRAAVLLEWGWNYVTYDRGARFIADLEPP
jgi:NADH dehydrogenase